MQNYNLSILCIHVQATRESSPTGMTMAPTVLLARATRLETPGEYVSWGFSS